MDTEVVTVERGPNPRTPWIVAAVATAVALVAITVVITAAIVDDGDSRPRPFDGRLVRAARTAAPHSGLGHGLRGEITKIEGDTITISRPGGRSVTVRTTEDTKIRVDKESTMSDLKVGDTVVVRGRPADDGVDAKHVVKTD